MIFHFPGLTDVPGSRVVDMIISTKEGMFYLIDSEGVKYVPSDGTAKLVLTKMYEGSPNQNDGYGKCALT